MPYLGATVVIQGGFTTQELPPFPVLLWRTLILEVRRRSLFSSIKEQYPRFR
jgi:hypothetical protein